MPKDRELNPVAAQRKKDKAKELRRNRDLRKQHREATLHSLTPDAIEQQLGKIRRVERGGGGVVDVHVVQKRQRLEVELVEARKRQQLQMEEEQKRASEQQPTVVIKGLDKIVGREESKESEEDDEDGKDDRAKKAEAAIAETVADKGPVDPAVEMGIVVPPGQRIWLDEPPGLKKPPYMPPPPTAVSAPSPSSALPLIAPSSLPEIRPSLHSPLSVAPPASEHPMIRIPLPSAPQPTAWQQPLRPPQPPPRSSAAVPSHSPASFRGVRPPLRSLSYAEPPEIDPLDPNPETALDTWSRGRGRGRGSTQTPTPPPPPAPPVPAKPAPRVIPRPAFVPTNLLVKNRPTTADTTAAPGRTDVSRPANTGSARVAVNAAPTVSNATATFSSTSSGVVRQRTQAELEYEALMRSLEAEGAL